MAGNKDKNRKINLLSPGDAFGEWTVVGFSHKVGKYRVYYSCKCSCGEVKAVDYYNLVGDRTKKCNKCSVIRHGMSRSRIYHIWCNKKRRKQFADHASWKDFKKFYADVGDPPSDKHFLSKIDHNKPYSSTNVKWELPNAEKSN